MNTNRKYWISVACKTHIERGISLGLFGVGHGKLDPLKRMSPHDMIIFYAPKIEFDKNTKENVYQKFIGYGEITDDPIFTEEINSACVFRRKINFLSTKEVSIHELINDLDFIQNKQKWGFPFMRGYVEISAKDFETIHKKLL